MIREEELGLTEQEAAKRLLKNGPNKLEQGEKSSALGIFAGQFKDMMVLILLAATAVSAIMGELHEALAIAAIVLLNALLGFFQEWRCEKTLQALAAMSAPTAKVIRAGKLREIPAEQVVEGDILELAAGDSVAADCVILSQNNLRCDESLLTGESAAVSKRAQKEGGSAKESMAFMGTHIVSGKATAKVCATGMNTEMGAVADMLGSIEEQQTPLQERLDHVGRVIGISCIAICGIVAAIGIAQGNSPFEMLITGISLAVAAVPEGLPAIVTISLALAVRRILRRNALIKRLHAVETLGCATVICSDKTGTLTQNKMRVQKVAVFDREYSVEEAAEKASRSALWARLFSCAAFCNDAKIAPPKKTLWRAEKAEFEGEPTEKALLEAAYNAGIRQQDFFRTGETPFSSESKMMTVFGGCSDGKERAFAKGAPEKILSLCKSDMTENGDIPLDSAAKKRITE
ncbi:MAG: HAD-IC family P-type ATPase, partial [Oscillospiraceae bacterium]|nr:HAD-IC family P-type ATPase [Oscillospiraceae bacterium]